MRSDLVEKYSAPVPRYTSYPTAPHFHARLDHAVHAQWLAELPPGTAASLYVHIPFCESLCWFCGCNMKATRRYAPVATYLKALHGEIELLRAVLPDGVRIGRIHWGGGSPTILSPEDISALDSAIRTALGAGSAAELSVEIDPRNVGSARLRALIEAGLTRASIGVQDFNETVQAAINRVQSFAVTRAVVDSLRLAGIGSLNVDVLYGLPHQRIGVLIRTLCQVLRLEPDRIALFGYAHVPWAKRHQGMIDAAALPDAQQRFMAAQTAADFLDAAGYRQIGLDHFAKPGDPLAAAARSGRLRRNFQGYTDDDCEVVIGIGASAISRLPQGYVQNTIDIRGYERAVGEGRLPTARGARLSEDDRLRGYAIERLMCDFRLGRSDLESRFSADARGLFDEAKALAEGEFETLLVADGKAVWITEAGRPFTRSICAAFDRYHAGGHARHSAGV